MLECLRAHRAGVHAQTAADFARNSFHPFQTADASGLPRVSHVLQLRADAGRDFISVDTSTLSKSPPARMNDHATNSAVAHEQDWNRVR